MFHCFDQEIVLEGMKEEISQQRGTIGAHWYTNNLPENRAPKIIKLDECDVTKSGAKSQKIEYLSQFFLYRTETQYSCYAPHKVP